MKRNRFPDRIHIFLPALLFLLTVRSGQGSSATWNLNPGSSDWNTASNWTPATVPNGSTDTATFGVSNVTAISNSANLTEYGIVFNPGSELTIDTGSVTKRPELAGYRFGSASQRHC